MTTHVGFPFRPDARGRTALANDEQHLRDLVEQVLFTAPGERVNRPDFGSGLHQLLFGPATPEIAATVQAVVQGALQQWLSDRLRIEAVDVESDESRLTVTVTYLPLRSQERRVLVFDREVGA
jgi:uncharacterized protein